jgi:hypothetical protein
MERIMTHIETGDMTVAELRVAIERHMLEAELHMGTAEALLEVASSRVLNIEPDAEKGGWLQ